LEFSRSLTSGLTSSEGRESPMAPPEGLGLAHPPFREWATGAHICASTATGFRLRRIALFGRAAAFSGFCHSLPLLLQEGRLFGSVQRKGRSRVRVKKSASF